MARAQRPEGDDPEFGTFDAPAPGEEYDSSGDVPPFDDVPPSDTYVPPTERENKAPVADSLVRKRTVTGNAKRSVSFKDTAQALDSRSYELSITEEGEMTFQEAQRVLQILTNEATLACAAYLELPVTVSDTGHVIMGAHPQFGAPMAAGGNGGGRGRERPAEGNGGGGRSNRSNDDENYTKAQQTAFWEDWAFDAQASDYYENFTDKSGNKSKWPNIKPKPATFERVMAKADPGRGPRETKPLYAKYSPPSVHKILDEEGISRS